MVGTRSFAVNLLPVHTADRVLDNDGMISFGIASPYPALPNLPPIGTMYSILGAGPISASPVDHDFSDMGDTGPRHTTSHNPHLMRSDSGRDISRQDVETRSSPLQPRSHKSGPISLPDPMTSS